MVPRFSIAQSGPSANSKVNIVVVGCPGVAHMCYGECRKENIVALCDVDSSHFPQWGYEESIPMFADFRIMLDTLGKEIDAVVVNTPDHTHFVATHDAMRRGKHVCSQKPLTHNIWQARTLVRAQETYGVVTTMAN